MGMQSSYDEIKEALGGKDPEEVLNILLKYIQRIKPKKVVATTINEENDNWDRQETAEDQRL